MVYKRVGERWLKSEPPEWLYQIGLDDVIFSAVAAKDLFMREGRMKGDENNVIFPYRLGGTVLLMYVDLKKGIIEQVDVLSPSTNGAYSSVVESWLVADYFTELKRKREMGYGMAH